LCKDDARRDAVRERQEPGGLDYVEVGDDQLTLTAYFLGKAPQTLHKGTTQHLRISGGRRIRDIKVIGVDVTRDDDPEIDDFAVILVDKPGDFSTYTLQLVGLDDIDPFYDRVEFSFKVNCPNDLDCTAPDLCLPEKLSEPEINYLAKDYASFRQLLLDRLALIMPDWQERHVPDLGITLVELLAYVGDHLSYYQDAVATEAYIDTARRRISVRRHARLVDYVLHEGCNARCWLTFITDTDLVGDQALPPKDIYFITSLRDSSGIKNTILTIDDLRTLQERAFETFEAMTDRPIELFAFQSKISFYTWGERECCLPRGATSATLTDAWESPQIEDAEFVTEARKLHLKSGDILIFEEILSPKTGQVADADPLHRHAVRLTKVKTGLDPLNGQPIVEIEWSFEDALPFPLCLSATTDAEHGCIYHDNISIAYGNVILVDHGCTIEPCEDLGTVPVENSEAICLCEEHPSDVHFFAGSFRPRLKQRPLTYSQALPTSCQTCRATASASGMLIQDPRGALPQACLTSILALADPDYQTIDWKTLSDRTDLIAALSNAGFNTRCYSKGVPLSPKLYIDYTEAEAAKTELAKSLKKDPENQKLKDDYSGAVTTTAELLQALISNLNGRRFFWMPRIDLLGSGRDERHFVTEIDNEGIARLRFGDDECGLKPEAASAFWASYRIGNGTRGNVGAESISHLVCRREKISGVNLTVRNPLPAEGGTEPEPISEAKLFAPTAFRDRLMRAVTADDYAALAEREYKTRVQHAAALLAWTGSWFEADVVIDPLGSEKARYRLLERIECTLQHYRRIGHDLEVKPACYVPIDLEVTVCVLPEYLRGHVKAAILAILSNRLLPDGRLGFFHPDNLSFGEGLYVSRIVATAQEITGVRSVRVTKLTRLFESPNRELENGVLPLGPLEVAQLDNDPSFPEHGKLNLVMQGGR